jgi:hypothetical protein
LKIAASFSTRGWDSTIVEGQRSVALPSELSIRVISVRERNHDVAGQITNDHLASIFQSENPFISFGLACAFAGRFIWRHRLQVGRRIPEANLYYLHSFEDYGAVRRVARRCGARIIYDAHDFYSGIIPLADMPPYRRHYIEPTLNWLERQCVAEADGIVTVGEGVADLMLNRFGRRPTVVQNAHDRRLDTAPRIGLRQMLELSANNTLLVTVGNRKIGQAVTEAVAALAFLPETVHLALIGKGYESALADAAACGVAGRVHAIEPVSPTEIVPFIRDADIGLVLYWPYSENFRNALPNGFFQVVSAGLPLIHGGLPEISRVCAEKSIGRQVELRQPERIAAALREWLVKPAIFRDQVLRAAAAAEALTWEEEEAVLFQLVDGVVLHRCDRLSVALPSAEAR